MGCSGPKEGQLPRRQALVLQVKSHRLHRAPSHRTVGKSLETVTVHCGPSSSTAANTVSLDATGEPGKQKLRVRVLAPWGCRAERSARWHASAPTTLVGAQLSWTVTEVRICVSSCLLKVIQWFLCAKLLAEGTAVVPACMALMMRQGRQNSNKDLYGRFFSL